MEDDLSQRCMEIWYFLYVCYKYDITLLPKEAKMIFSRKNTIKGDISSITEKDSRKYSISVTIPYWLKFCIDILERAPMILCTFMEASNGVFIYCFPVKKTGNLIYRINIWLLLQFKRLEIFCNKESSILYTIQP